jgi:hypothetical protein
MKKFAVIFLLLVSQMSQAAIVPISVVPTAWLLQNYLPSNVVLWFTGSSCASGMLALPPSATAADQQRLYATVLAAKLSNSKIFVYYDDSTPSCFITSFGAN